MCICDCSRCLCVLWALPGGGNSGCGVASYDDIVKNELCKKRTAEEIKAVATAKKEFNEGLYERALLLKLSATNGFSFVVPMKMLSSFFGLETVFPAKRIISVDFKLNSNAKNLIIEPGVSDKYALVVTAINLDLSYVTFESSLRTSWYDTISQQKLLRSFECEKVNHLTLVKSSLVHYVPNVLPFGIFPRSLVFCLIEEPDHIGCHSNRFVYKPQKLKSIQIFKNGQALSQNDSMKNMNLDDTFGPNCFYWYNSFLKIMPKYAHTISYVKFCSEFFLFCIDLCAIPSHLMVDKITGERSLNLISSGAIDLALEFSQLPSENLIVKFIGYHTSICEFDASGEMLKDDDS